MVLPSSFGKGVVILGPNCFFFPTLRSNPGQQFIENVGLEVRIGKIKVGGQNRKTMVLAGFPRC